MISPFSIKEQKQQFKLFKKGDAVNEEVSVLEIEHIALSRTNLSMQIADHLEELILTSPERINEKLPSEIKLARQYKVSRPVIREAFKLLQERGLVILKTGSGAYITRPEPSSIMNAITRIMQIDQIESDELAQIRQVLELASAELAATHITGEQLGELDAIIKRFEEHGVSQEERFKLDEAFHISIARFSGNRLLHMFVEILFPPLRSYMEKGSYKSGSIENAITHHKQIYDALASGDPNGAIKAMQDHLTVASENVRYFNEQRKN